MNSANIVYSIPELENEALDKNYKRFLKGLGLIKYNIFPHFQYLKDKKVYGLYYLNDIIYNEKNIKNLLCMDDGSFIYSKEKENLILKGKFYLYNRQNIKLIQEDENDFDLKILKK